MRLFISFTIQKILQRGLSSIISNYQDNPILFVCNFRDKHFYIFLLCWHACVAMNRDEPRWNFFDKRDKSCWVRLQSRHVHRSFSRVDRGAIFFQRSGSLPGLESHAIKGDRCLTFAGQDTQLLPATQLRLRSRAQMRRSGAARLSRSPDWALLFLYLLY